MLGCCDGAKQDQQEEEGGMTLHDVEERLREIADGDMDIDEMHYSIVQLRRDIERARLLQGAA